MIEVKRDASGATTFAGEHGDGGIVLASADGPSRYSETFKQQVRQKLVGNNPEFRANNRVSTDLPGGHAEAQDLFMETIRRDSGFAFVRVMTGSDGSRIYNAGYVVLRLKTNGAANAEIRHFWLSFTENVHFKGP